MTVTMMKDVALAVKPPRSMYLKFPFGSPMGRPGDVQKQTAVLKAMLDGLITIDTPGMILEPSLSYGGES